MRLSASPEAPRSTGTRSNGYTNQIIAYTCVGPQHSRYCNTLKAMNTENGMLCSKSPPTDEVRMHTQVECWAAGRSVNLTVAYCSDKKTRLSTRLLLIKTERGFGCSLYLKHTIENIFTVMHCTRDELRLNGVLSPHRRLQGSSCLEGASHAMSQFEFEQAAS